MSAINDAIRATQGPISVVPTNAAGTSQGTTATLIRAADTDAFANRRVIVCRVHNPNSPQDATEKQLAYGFDDGIKASAGDGVNCGCMLAPGETDAFSFTSDLPLYIVASEASCSYSVNYFTLS